MKKREQQILGLLADKRLRHGYEIADELGYRWWQAPVYVHLGRLQEKNLIVRYDMGQNNILFGLRFWDPEVLVACW